MRLSVQIPLKNLKIYNFFPAHFLPLLSKIGGRTASKFPGQKLFLAAPIELYCRIFDHLQHWAIVGVSTVARPDGVYLAKSRKKSWQNLEK